jgi:hypothetical protein
VDALIDNTLLGEVSADGVDGASEQSKDDDLAISLLQYLLQYRKPRR